MDEMRKKTAAISLLRELFRGYTSRNKEPERFSSGPERGTYKLYRLLVALKYEIMLPKTAAWLEQGQGSGADVEGAMVEVRVESLRYRRRIRLACWQLDFFLDEMDARMHLNVNRLNVNRLKLTENQR
jgi:hypothetical protein